jgi:anaerobic ribonucleoside-triphosphate reductase
MNRTNNSKSTGSTAPQNDVVLQNSERQRCEIWTRVMGYHRPIASYNIGKQSEFRERKYYRSF